MLLWPACRRYNADKQLTLYVGIGQALLLAWAVLTPMSAGNQPTVACESVFTNLQLTWSRAGWGQCELFPIYSFFDGSSVQQLQAQSDFSHQQLSI